MRWMCFRGRSIPMESIARLIRSQMSEFEAKESMRNRSNTSRPISDLTARHGVAKRPFVAWTAGNELLLLLLLLLPCLLLSLLPLPLPLFLLFLLRAVIDHRS